MSVELIPPKLDPNLPLWRYMKLSTFLLLLEGKAFLPSVATLQSDDSLEGDLHPEPEWLIGKCEDLSEGKFPELADWLKDKGEEWERTSLDAVDQSKSFRSQVQAGIYIRELAKRRAVWCWFASRTESAGMWSNYGHGGIAVRTSLGALSQALPSASAFQIAQIRYAGRDPNAPDRFDPESLGDDMRIHRPHLVKGVEYACEKEVRVVTACNGEKRGMLVREINVGSLIKEVVISPLLPREEAEAIKTLIVNHGCNSTINIRRSSLLGERAIAFDETLSAMDEFFGYETMESGLPTLIASL